MKVASDLGGVAGFGRVVAELDEPVFHAEWERRVLAMTLAMGAAGRWTLDGGRFAREDRPRAEYVSMTYYEIWLAALERLLLQADLVSADELAAGQLIDPPAPIKRRLEAAAVPDVLRRGGPTVRETDTVPAYAVGQSVRTLVFDPPGHTRLPTYARGKTGVVARVHGCFVFPDSNATGEGEDPKWLYTVEFSATELFGAEGDPRSKVSIDAFEPYLAAV